MSLMKRKEWISLEMTYCDVCGNLCRGGHSTASDAFGNFKHICFNPNGFRKGVKSCSQMFSYQKLIDSGDTRID